MPTRQEEARRALRKFWVAGAAGAFLSGLSRTFPVDFAARAWPPDWGYTFDLFLRYLYMFWFLIYFAIASFSTDKRFETNIPRKDVVFDVAQSIAALLAVFYLGFVTRGNSGSRIDYGYAYANSVIFLLSLLSWLFFSLPRRKKSRGLCFCLERISVLRELGIFFSLLGISSALLLANSLRTESLSVLQAALWCVLWRYWRIRWNHDENDNFENERIAIFDTVLKAKCAAKETTPATVRNSSAQPFAQSSSTNEIAPAPEPNSQNPSADPGK